MKFRTEIAKNLYESMIRNINTDLKKVREELKNGKYSKEDVALALVTKKVEFLCEAIKTCHEIDLRERAFAAQLTIDAYRK